MSKRVANKKGRGRKRWARSFNKPTKYTDPKLLRERRMRRLIGHA